MKTVEQVKWRPQAFGHRSVRAIRDPVIEPLWRGDRVIVTVGGNDIAILDTEGAGVSDGTDDIVEQLQTCVLAEEVVFDGYLTRQATPVGGTIFLMGAELPTAGQMTSQMLLGRGLRARSMTRELEESATERENPLAFVAVDLLLVDGQALLDIPLLERKRLLESALREADLVRRGAYVRPPVDTWLSSWRALGFRELAYKAANGRYLPGAVNDSWAIVKIPTN